MTPFRRIVARVDAGRAPAALRDQLDALLAGADGAEVELVHVVEPIAWYARPLVPDPDELERARAEHWERRLEEVAATLRRPGVTVRGRVASGHATAVLERIAAQKRSDLLALESPDPSTGPTPSEDIHFLRVARCPVWLARPVTLPIRRVLAAVDPRPRADDVDLFHLAPPADPTREMLVRRILELASTVAAALGAELHVAHAWSAPGEEMLRGEPFLSPEQVLEYVEAAGRARLAAFERALAEAGLDLPADRRHVVKGPAEDVILERVEAIGASLAVIGTVARGGLEALLGGTAEAVLRRGRCSLLTVNPAERADAPDD
jgi:nucleotide-binding universal stress UspA family protein